MTPRPPYTVGVHTRGHDTRHFPPLVESVPAHRNTRRRLLICPIAHCDKQQAILTCTGMADNATFVSRTRPTCVSSPDFHVGILAAMESTRRCSSLSSTSLATKGCQGIWRGMGPTHKGRRSGQLQSSARSTGKALGCTCQRLSPERRHVRRAEGLGEGNASCQPMVTGARRGHQHRARHGAQSPDQAEAKA